MLSLFTFSMLLLVIANNLLQAVIGWELVGLCSYLLIGFYWEKKSNQDAANKAFLTTKFGDVGLIVGVIVLSAGMFGAHRHAVQHPADQRGRDRRPAVDRHRRARHAADLPRLRVQVRSDAAARVAPDAMAGPTPVSALIHAATMVTAGVFLLARLFPVRGAETRW
jgi:NADH-quinone oxidoreductase subunit L